MRTHPPLPGSPGFQQGSHRGHGRHPDGLPRGPGLSCWKASTWACLTAQAFGPPVHPVLGVWWSTAAKKQPNYTGLWEDAGRQPYSAVFLEKAPGECRHTRGIVLPESGHGVPQISSRLIVHSSRPFTAALHRCVLISSRSPARVHASPKCSPVGTQRTMAGGNRPPWPESAPCWHDCALDPTQSIPPPSVQPPRPPLPGLDTSR